MAIGNAYLYRMPAGIPGAINRPDQATVEPIALDPTAPFPQYGKFGKTSATGTFVPLASGDAAALITGMLVRPFPTQGGATGVTGQLLVAVPPQNGGIGDRMKRGYLSVQLNWGQSVKDGPVYVCITAGGGHVVGDIGGDNSLAAAAVVVPNAVFTGAADNYGGSGADIVGQTEIAYNL